MMKPTDKTKKIPIELIIRVSKKIILLAGCGIKNMRPIFKTETLICQSKSNADMQKSYW